MASSIPKRGRGQRRRVTENTTPSQVAEADEVWHSTALNDSSVFGGNLQNIPPEDVEDHMKERISSRKKRLDTVSEEKDSGRGGSSTRDLGPDPGIGSRAASSSPVVINPPSGHSFFSSVLQKCGYILKQPNACNEIFYDVMKFRKEMSAWLHGNNDERCRVETETTKFVTAMQGYLTNKDNFVLSLKPTKHETELYQPSLLSCLLGVEELQEEVLKIVVPFIAEASYSAEGDDVVYKTLEQLKWQILTADVRKLCDNLISFLETAALECACHIIKALPDIVPQYLHDYAATKLLEKFGEEGNLFKVALMECFAALDIPNDRCTNVRYAAIDQMANAPLRDIPAYIAFLFQSESKDCLKEVISMMREKVRFTPEDTNPRNDVFQSQILEKVEFSYTMNTSIASVWIKLIKDDLQHGLLDNIKKIDLIMLFVFSDSMKSAANILKLLFAEHTLTLELFNEMITENKVMVYQLFPQISSLLNLILRGRVTKCTETVSDIIVELFRGLSDMEAQTLVGNLTSTLVNNLTTRETILKILTNLAELEPKRLSMFASYLMGILDYVMEFPARQIQALMNILAILSQTQSEGGDGGYTPFSAEFSILLRKQLSHSNLKIRCFGIIGALATVRQIALRSNADGSGGARMNELLNLAWRFVERDEDACVIFLDELSSTAEILPKEICNHFMKILMNKFENLWTMDSSATDQIRQYQSRNPLTLEVSFDANKECTDDRILINFEDKPMEMKPIILPAHLQALAALEKKFNLSQGGEHKNIDAVLGCPILFPSMDEYYLQESLSSLPYERRRRLGEYLVLVINFFRECVSAFVTDSDPELRIKIWARLENIVTLQKLLVKHLDDFPSLPFAYATDKKIEGGPREGPGTSAGGSKSKAASKRKPKAAKKAGGGKRGKKKPRLADEEELSEEDSEDPVRGTATAAGRKEKREVSKIVNLEEEIQPKQVVPYLRRFNKTLYESILEKRMRFEHLDICFSHLLANLSVASQDTSLVSRVETFDASTFTLILTDLKHQILDDKSNLNILHVRRLLRSVVGHIDAIYGYLQKFEEEPDPEATGLSREHQAQLEGCLRLLIFILNSHLEAVKKLRKETKARLLKKTMKVLFNFAQKGGNLNESTQFELFAVIGSYLGGLVSVIKSPSTALEHFKLLKTLHDLVDSEFKGDLKKAIDECARVYLRNEWKLPAAQVDGILKIWLGTAEQPLKIVRHLSKKLLVPEGGDQANERSEGTGTARSKTKAKIPVNSTYKSCSDSNFHVWYAAMLSTLSLNVHKKLRRRGELEEQIPEWSDAITIFDRLVNVTQVVQKPLVLCAMLRHCRLFLEAFVSGGVELFPGYYKQDASAAGKFCKSLQVPCRKIQYVCENVKKRNNPQMLKLVPFVKRVIESFVWRVREVLGLAGATDAFVLGNLKHRDLDGKEISSQIFEDDYVSESDSEQEENIEADEVEERSGGTVPLPHSSGARNEPEIDSWNEDSMDVDSD